MPSPTPPVVVTIRSSSQAELEQASAQLQADLDVGPVVAEPRNNRLNFDPAIADAGFKLLIAIGPAVATKLIDWAIETLKQRNKQARSGEPIPTLVVEVNGETISLKGNAKPAALRAALEAALAARGQ